MEEEAAVESMEEGEGKEEEEEEDGKEPSPKQPQVMAFETRGELGQYASRLQLSRTPLSELVADTSLADTYAGGRVISIFSAELTQGSVVILLQDDPRSDKYVQCVVSGDVTRLLPRSAQLGASEVYVHRATVCQSTAECSQEMDVEIRVEAENEKIWIVNREAGNGSFLPVRHPSEFQGRGGHARKMRRQRHMKAGLERERMAASNRAVSAPVSSNDPGPSSVVPPVTTSDPSTTSPTTATHYATGPDPPPSEDAMSTMSATAYSDRQREMPDFLDRAGGESHEEEYVGGGRERMGDKEDGEEGERERGGEHALAEEMSGGNSRDSSDDDEEEDRGQDRTLFPYHTTTKERGYTFLKLADLEAGLQKVNIFGVVTDFQLPFQTKGRDFCSIVNIIDESTVSGNKEPFKCTFFHSNKEKLPQVSKVGEIVCLHRINVKLFPNGIQGIGQSFSSSLMFGGRLGAKVKPATGSMSYTFTRQDKKRVKKLRLWNARRCRTANPYQHPLKDIQVNSPATALDLVCQVLSVSLRGSGTEFHTAVLSVWDGTQTRHRSLALDLSTFNTTAADSDQLQVADSYSEHVVVYGCDLVRSVASLVPGQFVCLQNLRAVEHTQRHNSFKDVFSAVELRLEPSYSDSGREAAIKVLSSREIEAFELKKVLKSRRKEHVISFRPLPPDVVPSSVTDAQHSQQQPVPLIALAKSTKVPAKFLCAVKVLGVEPQSVEELVQLCCPICKYKVAVTAKTTSHEVCTVCPPNYRRCKKLTLPPLQPVYFFKLKLADETGQVEAYVSGQQAAKFLSGFPPTVFFQHPQRRGALLEAMYGLTGGNDPFDCDTVAFIRPWVAVCLVSMKTNTADSNVSYHLFDTVLNTV